MNKAQVKANSELISGLEVAIVILINHLHNQHLIDRDQLNQSYHSLADQISGPTGMVLRQIADLIERQSGSEFDPRLLN